MPHTDYILLAPPYESSHAPLFGYTPTGVPGFLYFLINQINVGAQGWRLRPRTPMAQERFKQLLSLVDEALSSSLVAYGVNADGGIGFSSHAEQILQRWIALTEPRTQSEESRIHLKVT